MLMNLVNLLGKNEIYSNAIIAGKLGVSNYMLKQMLTNLVRLGYLENINPTMGSYGCSTGKCNGCAFGGSSSEQNESRNGVWLLTEKGRKEAGKRTEGGDGRMENGRF